MIEGNASSRMTTEKSLKYLAGSPAIGWQCDEWDRLAITTLMVAVKAATKLLDRAAASTEDKPITGDPGWWRDYYLFTGQHMILTDEGWEDGAAKQSYIDMLKDERYTLDDLILDEVNAPV